MAIPVLPYCVMTVHVNGIIIHVHQVQLTSDFNSKMSVTTEEHVLFPLEKTSLSTSHCFHTPLGIPRSHPHMRKKERLCVCMRERERDHR